jgi:hypothetical protein
MRYRTALKASLATRGYTILPAMDKLEIAMEQLRLFPESSCSTADNGLGSIVRTNDSTPCVSLTFHSGMQLTHIMPEARLAICISVRWDHRTQQQRPGLSFWMMLVVDAWQGDPAHDACLSGSLGIALVYYFRRRYASLGHSLEAIASDIHCRPDILVELASCPQAMDPKSDPTTEDILRRILQRNAFLTMRGNIRPPQPFGESLVSAILAAFTICTGESAAFGMISTEELGKYRLTATPSDGHLDSVNLEPFVREPKWGALVGHAPTELELARATSLPPQHTVAPALKTSQEQPTRLWTWLKGKIS